VGARLAIHGLPCPERLAGVGVLLGAAVERDGVRGEVVLVEPAEQISRVLGLVLEDVGIGRRLALGTVALPTLHRGEDEGGDIKVAAAPGVAVARVGGDDLHVLDLLAGDDEEREGLGAGANPLGRLHGRRGGPCECGCASMGLCEDLMQ
jgi:hypothetical protein